MKRSFFLVICALLASCSDSALNGVATIPSSLPNLALLGKAFGSGSLEGYCSDPTPGIGGSRTGVHCFTNINDGKYGNSNSWIASGTSFGGAYFAGVAFTNLAVTVSHFALGRDQTNAYPDRRGAQWTIEYTTDSPASHTTTSWIVAGTFILANATRHQFRLSPAVTGTAFRIRVSDPNSCMDELELYGAAASCSNSATVLDGVDTIPSSLPNLALLGNAFASGSLDGYCSDPTPGIGGSRTGIHCFTNINDGKYGNSNSWIASGTSFGGAYFAGVAFTNLAVTVSHFALGRDQTNAYPDRRGAQWTIEYTTDSPASHTTTSWIVAGTITLANATRHQFRLSPAVTGTAFRIRVSDSSSCMDELELYGTLVAPGDQTAFSQCSGFAAKRSVAVATSNVPTGHVSVMSTSRAIAGGAIFVVAALVLIVARLTIRRRRELVTPHVRLQEVNAPEV